MQVNNIRINLLHNVYSVATAFPDFCQPIETVAGENAYRWDLRRLDENVTAIEFSVRTRTDVFLLLAETFPPSFPSYEIGIHNLSSE